MFLQYYLQHRKKQNYCMKDTKDIYTLNRYIDRRIYTLVLSKNLLYYVSYSLILSFQA